MNLALSIIYAILVAGTLSILSSSTTTTIASASLISRKHFEDWIGSSTQQGQGHGPDVSALAKDSRVPSFIEEARKIVHSLPFLNNLSSGNSSGQTTPSGQSLASSASSGTQPSFLTKSNDWTTTGNSTDRSSVFSLGDWGEDEFDRAATRKVKSLFEDVDSWMFEQRERVDGQVGSFFKSICVSAYWGRYDTT